MPKHNDAQATFTGPVIEQCYNISNIGPATQALPYNYPRAVFSGLAASKDDGYQSIPNT